MKIAKVDVIVSSPDRNFVTLRVETDGGIVGLGDATVNGRELAVASYLADHLAPLLVGRDPSRIEDTWQYLYRGGYWRRGPITMAAVAAVDIALWDIKAKQARMPLYQLLGGACRNGLLAYGHASGRDIAELSHSVEEHLSQGYRAVRIQCAVGGAEAMYGVASSGGLRGQADERYDLEPARRGQLPVIEWWDTSVYLREIPRVFEEIRAKFGDELPLLHDVHHRLKPIEAARLAISLEPYGLFWLEDCTPAENQESLRLVRQHSVTPLAIGEILNSIWDYNVLFRDQLIDFVRSAVTHTGGISHLKKLLEYAALYQIRAGMHGPTDVSPVGMAAALHLGLALHNFGIQEYMPHSLRTAEVFDTSYTWSDGYLHPGDEPGLGVELNRERAETYPYARAYLPVARLRDGTVHDW